MLKVECFAFSFSSRQPDQPAQDQDPAGQRAQQEPADGFLLALRHRQPEFRDRPRPDAFEQHRAVEQPVDGVTGEIPVGEGFDLPVVEKRLIARHNHARGAARIGDTGNGFLLNGDHERIIARGGGGVESER